MFKKFFRSLKLKKNEKENDNLSEIDGKIRQYSLVKEDYKKEVINNLSMIKELNNQSIMDIINKKIKNLEDVHIQINILKKIKILLRNKKMFKRLFQDVSYLKERVVVLEEELNTTKNPQLVRNERLISYHIKVVKDISKGISEDCNEFLRENFLEKDKIKVLNTNQINNIIKINNKVRIKVNNKYNNLLRSYKVLREFFENKEIKHIVKNMLNNIKELKKIEEIELLNLDGIINNVKNKFYTFIEINKALKKYSKEINDIKKDYEAFKRSNDVKEFNENIKRIESMKLLLNEGVKKINDLLLGVESVLKKYQYECKDKSKKILITRIIGDSRWILKIKKEDFENFKSIIQEIIKSIEDEKITVNIKKKEKLLNKLEKIKTIDDMKVDVFKKMKDKIDVAEKNLNFDVVNKQMKLEKEVANGERRIDELKQEKEEMIIDINKDINKLNHIIKNL